MQPLGQGPLTGASMRWGGVDPDQKEAVPICQAFDKRRRGERLRLKAVASDSRFRAGQAPSGQALAGLIE